MGPMILSDYRFKRFVLYRRSYAKKIGPKRHVTGGRFYKILSENNLLGQLLRVTVINSGKFYVDPENMTP